MTQSKSPGFIRRIWNWFWTPAVAISSGFLLIAGFLAGILFWGGFHWSMEMTNTEEFCVGCHNLFEIGPVGVKNSGFTGQRAVGRNFVLLPVPYSARNIGTSLHHFDMQSTSTPD